MRGECALQLPHSLFEISITDDIVAFKDRTGLVAGDRHRYPFQNASADKISYRRYKENQYCGRVRQNKEFYERSRLDKQNLIRSLEWTGESLYDLANDRITASNPKSNRESEFNSFFNPRSRVCG